MKVYPAIMKSLFCPSVSNLTAGIIIITIIIIIIIVFLS